jgi:hypothetical protein
MGSLNLIGLRTDSMFFKKMLEKLDISLDSFKRKNYKNAIKVFTNE